MSSETEAAQLSNGTDAVQVISPNDDHRVTPGDDDRRHLNDAVRSLPSHAVKDLLSAGVCIRCIFRLFGISDHAYFRSSLSPSVMCNILGEGDSSSSESMESELKPGVCRICLGILQFIYRDEKEMLVKRKNGDELAASIAELIRQEGHQIDGFSLEVSIPPIIFENEQAVRLYMKKKYGSELWFQERLSECISTKDALKFAIVNPLEIILDVKSGPSYVRIRLTYTETKPSIIPSKSVDRNGGSKRRKTGMQVCLHVNEMLFSCKWPFLPWSTAAVNPLIFSILVFIMMIPCLPETQCFWLRILYILNAQQL